MNEKYSFLVFVSVDLLQHQESRLAGDPGQRRGRTNGALRHSGSSVGRVRRFEDDPAKVRVRQGSRIRRSNDLVKVLLNKK